MTPFDNRHSRHVSTFFLRFLGLSPYQSRSRRICSCIIYFTLNLSLLIPQVSFVAHIWNKDPGLLIECLFALIINLVCLARYSIACINNSMYKQLYEEPMEYWQDIRGEEREIFLKYVDLGRRLGTIYCAYLSNAWVVINMLPTIPLQPRINILHNDYLFFKEEDYRLITSLHIAIVTLTQTMVMASLDSVLIMFTILVCGLFSIISFRLETIKKSPESAELALKLPSSTEPRTKETNLGSIVSLHNQCLQYRTLLENTKNLILMIVQGAVVLLVSSLYFYETHVDSTLIKKSYMAIAIIGFNAYLFFTNWLGQKIIDSSEEVFDSAYSSQWDMMSVDERKSLLIIMQRSSRPCVLTAGIVSIMSLETFSNLMKASMSYFTAMTSMSQK